MRKILLGLVLFGLLISTLGYSQYKVVGSQIYNGNTPVVMRGTNVNGPNWVWGRETTQDAKLIVNVWKFNIVRVNQFMYGSRLTTNNNLDLIVNTFTGLGCVVMLEVHDFTGKEPTDAQLTDLKNFWIDKANKYKNNDKVWFNIENEPVDGWNGSVTLTTRWRDVHDQCIGVIRAAGANNICVCDDNGWGGPWVDSQSGIMTYGQFLTSKYSNVAFGVHLYDDRISVANLTAWLNSIISKGLCPIVGEFGVNNGTACPKAPTNLFNILHNTSNSAALQNVGRLSWHWASGDANRYCTTGDGNGYNVNKTDGVTRPTNLVANFGGLIWDDNHSGIPAKVAVTGVTVSPTSASVAIGATTQLTATVAPSNATNKAVNWSSSNTAIATVNSNGLVTGIVAGSATITVTTVDGNKTSTSSITVSVATTWTKVDDTDASIAYSSGWGTYTGNGGYLNTEHYVPLAGATATFTFTGTKARFYGFKRYDLGNAEISVDGIVVDTIDCYNSSQLVNQMLYETAALTSGSHTLKVKCTGTKNASASSYQTIVDAFEYTLKSDSLETSLISPAKSSVVDVQIYPNPVTEQTAVWVNSSEAAHVSLNIYNVIGKIVWSIKTNARGDTKIPIDLIGQGKGIYIVKVQIGDKVVSKTIVK